MPNLVTKQRGILKDQNLRLFSMFSKLSNPPFFLMKKALSNRLAVNKNKYVQINSKKIQLEHGIQRHSDTT